MMDLAGDFYANNNLHSVASLPPSLHSPAGLAWPLVGDLDKSVVEGQIVTDRVLPACVAAVVDPSQPPSPATLA